MDYIGILGAIAIVGGAILAVIGVLGATSKMKNKFIKTKLGAGAVGAIVLAGGILVGGYPVLVDSWNGLNTPTESTYTYTPPATTTTATGYEYAQFQITPSCQSAGNLTLNAAKTIYTLPAKANTTAHTITTLSKATFVQPSMKFVLNPLAWEGSLTTNTATVYFDVSPGQQYITPAAGTTYKLLTETTGNANARFNNTGNTITQYGSGQLTCALTSSITVYVNLTLNKDSCSRIDNTYDPITEIITFHNKDSSWSESYTLSFFLEAQYA
jgi:hypothetical protein